ncbi:uncharacterized protein B0I36DRAFT_85617 [Microdochium trichocladiopsis]|uniref:Uncharacterized protein n=1 Tax=Microdochium trichocladiopsis TaxID=1682393 RepID=A0A9P8YDF2_9PEZI|nr:uncharacterized protein B0I36DRAFT_85617 [Microdochium trichocladiopsis]KAH7034916.1 hypothetical protein B0I36DRAFT_85617 [Microdochium trichocladiopsis]
MSNVAGTSLAPGRGAKLRTLVRVSSRTPAQRHARSWSELYRCRVVLARITRRRSTPTYESPMSNSRPPSSQPSQPAPDAVEPPRHPRTHLPGRRHTTLPRVATMEWVTFWAETYPHHGGGLAGSQDVWVSPTTFVKPLQPQASLLRGPAWTLGPSLSWLGSRYDFVATHWPRGVWAAAMRGAASVPDS